MTTHADTNLFKRVRAHVAQIWSREGRSIEALHKCRTMNGLFKLCGNSEAFTSALAGELGYDGATEAKATEFFKSHNLDAQHWTIMMFADPVIRKQAYACGWNRYITENLLRYERAISVLITCEIYEREDDGISILYTGALNVTPNGITIKNLGVKYDGRTIYKFMR